MINASEYIKSLEKKSFLVYGLARTSTAVVKVLVKAGATVFAGDDDPEKVKDFCKEYSVKPYLSGEQDWSDIASLVLSPGVPFTHPEPHDVVQEAAEADVEVICDIELFFRIAPSCKTVGVTGTNGKSTTACLVYSLLKEGGKDVALAGNIGNPVFTLNTSKKEQIIVLELSSFQIDLMPEFRPDISVLTNITPDHLDRHGTFEQYAEVKSRLFVAKNGDKEKVGIICTDDKDSQKIYNTAKEAGCKMIEVSTMKKLSDGVYVEGDHLWDAQNNGEPLDVGDVSDIPSLKGVHNYQNGACAYVVARTLGMGTDEIFAAMKTFPGLEHRQYLVRTLNGVGYINDSKATNAAASAMALGCRNNIYWIVGGRKKKTGLEGLETYFKNVKHAFLIGESMDDFADWLGKYGVEYTRSMTMERAVEDAHNMAQENRGQPGGTGVVLLSPACASFDQFASFEERGNVFTKLVQDLPEDSN
ncbi:MAG: UDP-N-acetylmuramoyl-L-alanine--D-glutamate ligase [Alphaproteobacteria bacterium]|nr:UDP-N-acetylmuramoyl-L-alanine--D-glutamate ligase [Alphaproteobacteria bacterium]